MHTHPRSDRRFLDLTALDLTALDLPALRLGLLLALGATACGDKDEDDDGDTGSSSIFACTSSTPVLAGDGTPTGYERCADGSIHRVSAESSDPTISDARCEGTEDYLGCTTDGECTAGSYGACLSNPDEWGEGTSCSCAYSCASDADCDSGEICLPPDIVETGRNYATCVAAACTVDADCDSGECGLSSWDDGCGWTAQLQCRADEDECRSDDDCTDSMACVPGWETPAYTCRGSECDIGRPLRVAGDVRFAPMERRLDWQAPLRPQLPADVEARARLAMRWAHIGALEHASVASFARFTLQLMALGAPSDLVADTQRAAADEVEHARLAYGLASAYAGRGLGPGALALADAAPRFDPVSVVVALVEEACVGETVGVAEARGRAAHETDPVVQTVLQRIAEDEARHAALAWRSLRWLVEQHGEEVREAAERALERAIGELLDATLDLDQRALRGAVIAQVVRPTAVEALRDRSAASARLEDVHLL